MKWCAGTVLPRLPPQCRCGDLLVIYRRVNWRPWLDSHQQPPGSKPDALLVELQG